MKMAKDMNTVSSIDRRLVRECSSKESANTCYCNNTMQINGYKDNDSSFIVWLHFGKTAEVDFRFCSKRFFHQNNREHKTRKMDYTNPEKTGQKIITS